MVKRFGWAAAALAVLLLAGCGSSSRSSGQTASLSRAAYVSSSSPGYRAIMTMQESIPGLGQTSINATSRFSTASHAGTIDMQMTLPSAASAQLGSSTMNIQAVLVPGTIYMKFPPQLASKVPGGKPWWQINIAQLGKVAGIPGISSLMSGTSSVNNPGQYMYFLRATSSGSVKSLGHATVNGVATTHYHALLDMSKLPSAVPASDRAGVQQLVSALQQRGALTSSGIPVDAWIDSGNHVRQIEMHFVQPVNGQSANVSMKMDFVDYGPQPVPKTPPASQTLNMIKLLQQEGVGSAGSAGSTGSTGSGASAG